jgi:hypothetical protein
VNELADCEDGDDIGHRDAGPGGDQRRGQRRRRQWIVLGIVGVVLVWGALATSQVLAAYHAGQQGTAELDRVRLHLTPGDLTAAGTQLRLRSAEQDFAGAHASLSSWVLAPLTVVPVAGRQLASLRGLSAAAGQVAATGSTFLAQTHVVLHAPHGAGPQRIEALRRLSVLSSMAADRLGSIETGPSRALMAPLAAKHDQFVTDLERTRGRLERAGQVSAIVADILQGPQTYLVMASNNAEMRSGSGMFLDIGMATTGEGSVHLGKMTLSSDLIVPPGAVTVSGDLQRNWGWLDPGQDWRNLGVTPRFDVTAPLAAQMWQARTGQSVDGVLSLDVAGLRELLRATGPVNVGGVTVSADTAVSYIEHDEYTGLSDGAIQSSGRQEGLGALASAVLNHLQSQSTDLSTLGSAMAAAAQGRHLLVWSRSRPAESGWRSAGVAGTLSADSVAATVINRGGNKLDQYLSADVRTETAGSGSNTKVTMTIHLHNATPLGQSQFIAGPYPGSGASYGEYTGLISINLPAAASHRSVGGNGRLVIDGVDGPTWLLVSSVDIQDGASEDVVVRFEMPGRHGVMTVVPSARIPPVHWDVSGTTFMDDRPVPVRW